jgi:hypothetical protein
MLVLWVPLLPLYFIMKRVLDGRSGVSRCAVARWEGGVGRDCVAAHPATLEPAPEVAAPSGVTCRRGRLAGAGLARAHPQGAPGCACVRRKRKADSSVSTKPVTTFADVAGVGPAKEELAEVSVCVRAGVLSCLGACGW